MDSVNEPFLCITLDIEHVSAHDYYRYIIPHSQSTFNSPVCVLFMLTTVTSHKAPNDVRSIASGLWHFFLINHMQWATFQWNNFKKRMTCTCSIFHSSFFHKLFIHQIVFLIDSCDMCSLSLWNFSLITENTCKHKYTDWYG